MTPRPLHRWKSFRLGLLVLTFLGWAWVRSMTWIDGVELESGSWRVVAGQDSGRVHVVPSHIPGLKLPRKNDWFHERAERGRSWFPEAGRWEHEEFGWAFVVAHWLLILLFLIPWSAFLLWRGRRMKRRATVP